MASQESSKLTSTSHRLPTISASQALQNIQSRRSRAISTGLPQLNRILSPDALPGNDDGNKDIQGGLARGKVTEVYGPSGVGKTAFGIQAAANALKSGSRVVWIDAATSLVPRRFNDILLGTIADANASSAGKLTASQPEERSLRECQSHFHHHTCPTLAHLLALFVHPPPNFPPPNTSFIVIDSLSTLLDDAYPRNGDDRSARNKGDQARWAAQRKFAVLNELISKLCKVAALHDIALLVTCQTITRIRGTARALLVPAISGTEWDNSISTRLVLYRDWIPGQGKWNDAKEHRSQSARFVGVEKANGAINTGGTGPGSVVPFTIESSGLRELSVVAALDIATPIVSVTAAAVAASSSRPPKRRFTEIADSEDEDPDSDELYGWVEDDGASAPEGMLFDEEAAAAEDVNAAETPRIVEPDRTLPASPSRG